jgi:hypothetical protein
MALFTDQNATTIEDLRKHESRILDLAAGEGIDLSVKLQLAQEEVGLRLSRFLQRQEARTHGAGDTLTSVVVTEGLRRWCTLQTLTGVYRDAYSSQLNDRYRAKWQEYEKQAATAAENLFEFGVGVVANPIARPEKPTLSPLPAPGAPGGSYYVAVSWVNAQGVEGCASDPMAVDLSIGFTVIVDAGQAVLNGTSWNVYAGRSPFEMTLQNAQPIPSGSTWALPATGLINGRPPGTGQIADYLVRQRRVLPRG